MVKDEMICQDHHKCRNGGICVSHPDFPGSYTCDCAPASASGKVFAGLSCDHEATTFCNVDNTPNQNSFCTNNGTCVATVDQAGGTHYGCVCPDNYTGEYCELVKGQGVPTYVMSPPVGQSVRGSTSSSKDSGNNNTAMVASLTVTAALLMIGLVLGAYFVVKRRNSVPHATESPKSIRQADSAQLDADGQILRDSMHNMTSPTSAGGTGSMNTSPRTLGDVSETVEIDEEDGV